MKTTRRATRKWTRNRKRIPVADRLPAKLRLGLNGCLEFTGAKTEKGYGQLRGEDRIRLAHRVAWELANGPIPEGMFVLHHCDNPPCCQTEPTEGYPDGHLFLGTNTDNMRDMVAKGRHWRHGATHCKRGHPFDEANTRVNVTNGYRFCRECQLATKRRYYARRVGKAS